MDKVKTKEYSEKQIERARQNYQEYLQVNCSKKEVIEILTILLRDYFPVELCIAHLN